MNCSLKTWLPHLSVVALALLSACSAQQCPTYAVKQWNRDEQIEIATERNILASPETHPLYDKEGKRVFFPMAPSVFQGWETMRRELK